MWKGSSRVPYFTYPANVAVILTRYGQDDDTVVAGIIGGSGLYDMAELTDRKEERVSTPFGEPSAPYVTGTTLAVDGGLVTELR